MFIMFTRYELSIGKQQDENKIKTIIQDYCLEYYEKLGGGGGGYIVWEVRRSGWERGFWRRIRSIIVESVDRY